MRWFRQADSGTRFMRRLLLLALLVVVGSGIMIVQGMGGKEDSLPNEIPAPLDLAGGPEAGGNEPNESTMPAEVPTEAPEDGLRAWLTWPEEVGNWTLVDEVFSPLVVPDVAHVVWELAAEGRNQVIHVVAWERTNHSVRLHSELARGQVIGLETVVDAAKRVALAEEETAVAAINADFFLGSPVLGQPVGMHVSAGQLIADPNGRPFFALFEDGRTWMGHAETRASVERVVGGKPVADFPLAAINRAAVANGLTLYTPPFGRDVMLPNSDTQAVVLQALLGPLRAESTHQAVVIRHVTGPAEVEIPANGGVLVGRGQADEFIASLRPADRLLMHLTFEPSLVGVQQAIAGSHILVRHGEPVELDFGDPLVSARHPRTAIGFSEETMFLMTVDGRQVGYADGMTLPELAELLVALGAEMGLNLDGGGSTTLAVRASPDQPLAVVNRPSDGIARPVSNALILLGTEPLDEPDA